jgi:hypothetical protein
MRGSLGSGSNLAVVPYDGLPQETLFKAEDLLKQRYSAVAGGLLLVSFGHGLRVRAWKARAIFKFIPGLTFDSAQTGLGKAVEVRRWSALCTLRAGVPEARSMPSRR